MLNGGCCRRWGAGLEDLGTLHQAEVVLLQQATSQFTSALALLVSMPPLPSLTASLDPSSSLPEGCWLKW